MILDMRAYNEEEAKQATIIVNASLEEFLRDDLEYSEAKIISFDSFADERVCSASKIKEFLERRESICPQVEIIDLSRACTPKGDLVAPDEAKRFYRFVKALKENTDIDIIATPELEKLFPILLKEKEDDDKLSEAYVIPLKEEKYSALQAITKLQLAQAGEKITPELCYEIMEHNNNNAVTEGVISAIDVQLSKEPEQLDAYIPTLLGCMAGRYISPNNFDALIDIAEKYIPKNHITTEDINFCFGLQKESSQSEEAYQRINNLIKELIPHLPEEVRQKLDEEVALKEKKQQEYLQKRQKLQAKVDEYSDYLLISDAIHKDVSSEHIRKITNTIYENAEKYTLLYRRILIKIDKEGDEYKRKAASHWIEPIIFRINALGPTDNKKVGLLNTLTRVVTKNQDVRHEYGHIFCQQLQKNNNSEFWLEKIASLLHDNSDDHILLMNTYEDMEQAYKLHPELIPESLEIFKETLGYSDIAKGFNDHLHTLASIVGDTARDYPECTDTAIEILNDLSDIEKQLNTLEIVKSVVIEKKLNTSPSKSYLRSKIDEAFDKIKQNDIASNLKRELIFIHEKDPKIFADAVKDLMNDPKTDEQHIESAIEMRLNSGLNVLIDDNDSAECLKWNLAVLQSKALQDKGPENISACAEKIFKNSVLKQLQDNPNYDPSETLQAIYDAAPFWLHRLREKISDTEDLLILQNFDRIPQEVQKLYIGENPVKIDNLIKTDNFKYFPGIAAQKLKLEVCDYLSDISSMSTCKNHRSLSGMEKWATVLKEIGGYSSPFVCVFALNEAMRIRESISLPKEHTSCEYACKHFPKTNDDIKRLVKISTDIIDNVFEQIRDSSSSSALINELRKAKFDGLTAKVSLQDLMGEEAAKAFLSGDESYKNLWDKQMALRDMNAYLMFKKPHEILQDTPFVERKNLLNKIRKNTYLDSCSYDEWKWKDFPELLTSDHLWIKIRDCPDKADEDVVKAVKTYCKTRIYDEIPSYSGELLSSLMLVYDAEVQKGIEDKEIFSILYKARFSAEKDFVRRKMASVYSDYKLTAPKLQSLCQKSYLINKWRLKNSTLEKK